MKSDELMDNLSTSTLVVAAVSVGLFLMVAVAFTLQTIEKNNREKRRLLAALQNRARDFEYMLQGLPDGLLNRDLRLLVCQCLLEVYAQIEPLDKQSSTRAAAESVRQQMNQLKGQTTDTPYRHLENPGQIREIQQQLKSLFQFVERLYQNGRITAPQAKLYGSQLRRLNVLTSLDSCRIAARQALDAGKPRLAIHYHQMAIDRIKRQNADGFFNAQLEQLGARIAALEAQMQAPEASSPDSAAEPVDEAWKSFETDDGLWKKKSLYDE